MKEEISLDIAMSKEEMAKIKELLTSSPGLRHYAFQLKKGEYLDLVEYKDYEKLEEENKSLQSQLKEKEESEKEFIKYLEAEKDRLAREVSQIYEDSLGKTKLVNEDIFNEVNNVLSKYNEILSKGENK